MTVAMSRLSHEPFVACQVRQHGLDFIASHHNGQAFGLASADNLSQVAYFTARDINLIMP